MSAELIKNQKMHRKQSDSAESFLVVAGEHSGDLLGADLVSALKQYGFNDFWGTGGNAMKRSGVQLLENVESLEVIGFWEAIKAYSRLKKLAYRLLDFCKEKKILYAVLIDYPGFNLYLARLLHQEGIRVFYLVSPQIWAWHYSRIKKIRDNVDLMLTLFPFEKEMYEKEGVRAEFVGHPIAERIPAMLKAQKLIPLGKKRPIIGILPGSRGSEITRLLPSMLDAALLLREYYPDARFLLPSINEKKHEYIQSEILRRKGLDLEYFTGRSIPVMEASDVVMVASGTATLEAALLKKPMVILYRVSFINYLIGSLVTRVRYIGLPNILARRQVALELLQSEVTPENIAREVKRILSDSRYRLSITKELEYVRDAIGKGRPASKAARFIHTFISRG